MTHSRYDFLGRTDKECEYPIIGIQESLFEWHFKSLSGLVEGKGRASCAINVRLALELSDIA